MAATPMSTSLAHVDYALLDRVIDILKSGDAPTIHSLNRHVEVLHERLRPATPAIAAALERDRLPPFSPAGSSGENCAVIPSDVAGDSAIALKTDQYSVPIEHADTTDKFFFALSSDEPRVITPLKSTVNALYQLLLLMLREQRTTEVIQ